MPSSAFTEALNNFAKNLKTSFASSVAAQSEDQLKSPTQTLLQRGAGLNRRVVAKTEAQVQGLGGRPDIGVDVDGLLVGFVELKAPGLGTDPRRFDERNKKQWEKFKTLPNLIYTDSNEWTLFRSGQKITHVRFTGDVTEEGERAITDAQRDSLERLLQDFLLWQPIVPSSPKALAELLAPLCRFVRDDVTLALQEESSSLSHVARDWRETLFPDADDSRFADAYAQTLTYALLLARLSGADNVTPDSAAQQLDSGHGLLAGALRVLGNPDVRRDVGVGLDVLIRSINAIDIAALKSESGEPWLYFYEDFLAKYDPKLRNDYGVYYTPNPVILAQVRLVSELLETRFGKEMSFASDGVVVLDPAAGTGAYPLAIMQHALEHIAGFYGEGMRSQYATGLAQNIHAFEFLVGPYAVAHLRVTQKILAEGGQLPSDGVHVYLADTLESPEVRPMEQHGFMYRRLSEEYKRVQRVKKETRVLVCIGNPPYDRQQRNDNDIEQGVELKGGWVRFGEQNLNDETKGILKDFIEPATQAGQGKHIKNLYNAYVYFWRWAMWKTFEQSNDSGIVCFITAASYLRGPGFVGMREHMRRTFDELWIIDLEGDSLGARKTENVFNIQTPVAIALGVRYGKPKPNEPAKVHYAKIEGTRESKFEQLAAIQKLDDLVWQECLDYWQAPLLPRNLGIYGTWPLLTDIFPWQHSGVQFKRNWPIAESKTVLETRWEKFLAASARKRSDLFRETDGRKVGLKYKGLNNKELPALSTLATDAPSPPISRYGFRSFDRQWTWADTRFADRMRNDLWDCQSSKQIFIISLLTEVLGLGPTATISAEIPDLHYFRGSFGGKHVIPLWRDAEATQPNITTGLLDVLSKTYGTEVTAEDLFAYAYGILASPSYVEKFSEELTLPGPRLPITKNANLFKEVVTLGRILIGWHTYGERFGGSIPRGKARNTVAIPSDPEHYPNEFSYNPQTQTLHVGTGQFSPVSAEVWEFSVSGLDVVKSWLGYRMRERAGRSSSDLDKIRPERWEFTKELLELLWVLEATVAKFPNLAQKLEQVVSGAVFTASEFPVPIDLERKPPQAEADAAQGRLGFGQEED